MAEQNTGPRRGPYHDQVRQYAFNAGFYVIEQSGDTVRIGAPAGFTPRMW
jgi:hypothetical protein